VKTEPHAFARVVFITFRTDTIDLAAERFRTVSTPLVRRLPGSLGVFGGANRTTGNSWAISLWQTRADLERSNADPEVTAALTGYAPWMAGPFSVQSYAIVDMAFPGPDPAALGEVGRMTMLAPQPGSEPDVIAALRDYLAQLRERSGACLGTLLMVPHIGNQILALELWSSEEELHGTGTRLADQRIRQPGTLERPPAREMFDMFGRY